MGDIAIIRKQANIGALFSPQEMERMAKRRFQDPSPSAVGRGGRSVFGATNLLAASTFASSNAYAWQPRR